MKFITVLGKFEKFTHRLSGWFEWIGVAGLLLMMTITCIDVFGAKVFTWRLLGAIDMVMLCQAVAIASAVAITLILGRHVRVEFFVARLPKLAQAVINSIILILVLGFFILIIWHLYAYGHSLQTGGEVSDTARLPLYPFAYWIALSSIPVCFVLLLEFLNSLARIVRR